MKDKMFAMEEENRALKSKIETENEVNQETAKLVRVLATRVQQLEADDRRSLANFRPTKKCRVGASWVEIHLQYSNFKKDGQKGSKKDISEKNFSLHPVVSNLNPKRVAFSAVSF